jgi:hypothetical protein
VVPGTAVELLRSERLFSALKISLILNKRKR